MTFYDYNAGIPAANNNPSDDQSLMQTNTNSIQNLIAGDHHGFEDDLGGYHTIIHQDTATRTLTYDINGLPVYTSEPAAIPGPPQINQLFSMLVTPDDGTGVADTQLFSLTANSVGNNGLSQLTGNFSSTDGYQWIGGVLIQWGFVSVAFPVTPAVTAANVVFKNRNASLCIPFPNSLFTVIAVPARAASAGALQATVSISTTTFDKTRFRYIVTATGTGYTGFYWVAIGR